MYWYFLVLILSIIYVVWRWEIVAPVMDDWVPKALVIVFLLPLAHFIACACLELVSFFSEKQPLNTDAQAFFADVLEYDEVTKKVKVQVLDEEGNPTGEIIEGVVMVEKINLA